MLRHGHHLALVPSRKRRVGRPHVAVIKGSEPARPMVDAGSLSDAEQLAAPRPLAQERLVGAAAGEQPGLRPQLREILRPELGALDEQRGEQKVSKE